MDKLIIASGPVIVQAGKVLLDISGDDDYWKFCGGRVGAGLSLRETASVRAQEELGIKIVFTDKDPFLLYLEQEKKGEKYEILLLHWLCSFTGEIQPGADVKKWAWIDLLELGNYNLAPNIMPTLSHFGFI